MRNNIIITLTAVPDTKFVKEQIKELRKRKIYPYPFRWESLKTDENILRRVLIFLQPIELFFWILHMAYKLRKRKQ